MHRVFVTGTDEIRKLLHRAVIEERIVVDVK